MQDEHTGSGSFNDRFVAVLKSRNLSVTKQRRGIAQVVSGMSGHYSIDQIHRAVRGTLPNVGYTTVYRTMKVLVDSELVIEHKFGNGVTRFEIAGDDHHDHMVCLSCGDVAEFQNQRIEELQLEVAQSIGFHVTNHRHILYGYCSKLGCTSENS